MAETHSPDLPWRDSLLARVTAFASDLEVLCRKHGIWLAGGSPTTAPHTSMGDGSETGYRLRPGWTCHGYYLELTFGQDPLP